MINVFLLEDRYDVRVTMVDSLEENNFEVCACKGVFEADEEWDAQTDTYKFGAVIIDLMMSSEGLSENERELTNDGLYTGWVWLWGKIKKEITNPKLPYGRRVIIHSAYTEDYLKDLLRGISADNTADLFLKTHVKIVQKSPESMDEIINILNDMDTTPCG